MDSWHELNAAQLALGPAILEYKTGSKKGKVESERAKLVRQQERKLRIANDKAEAGLLSMDDATRVLTVAYRAFDEASKGLPKKLAPKLAKVKTAFEARRTIEKEFTSVRELIGAELKAVCGLDPVVDENAIKVRLRRSG